jgi:hypothetical protein
MQSLKRVKRTLRRLVPSELHRAITRSLRRATGTDVPLHIGCELPHLILVATHHKTGTVWMRKVFQTIARVHSLRFHVNVQDSLPANTDIFFQNASKFELGTLPRSYRGVHIVRDPRDVIVSACFYHQKAAEPWLHIPDPALDGKTYQQALNELPTLEDKLSFEMRHATRRVIDAMAAWNYQDRNFLEVKYEDLIVDVDLVLFHRIFQFLGFPGQVIPSVLAIALDQSLFSGKSNSGRTHVRSGAAAQWPRYFETRHKAEFLGLFGDVLVRLGYEADDTWSVADRST